MDSDGFTIVKPKKGKGKQTRNPFDTSALRSALANDVTQEGNYVNVDKFVSELEKFADDFRESEFFQSFLSNLTEHLSPGSISRLVCLGIGTFTSDRCSIHQLQFLVCLARHLNLSNHSVLVYDPKLTKSEQEILKRINFSVESSNEEGKYPISENSFFYFPHCPKHLTNNLLWSNWSLQQLSKVFLLSNSFERIVTNLPERFLKQEGAEFIRQVSDVVRETPVKNCYRINDVFNDTSLHSFPENILSQIKNSEDFWNRGKEPVYQEQDFEFVRK